MLKGSFPIKEFEGLRTPFYYYDIALLRRTLDTIKDIFRENPDYRLHYAVKANNNPRILRTIASYGFGADCVSGGEIRAAVDAGFKPSTLDWTLELPVSTLNPQRNCL